MLESLVIVSILVIFIALALRHSDFDKPAPLKYRILAANTNESTHHNHSARVLVAVVPLWPLWRKPESLMTVAIFVIFIVLVVVTAAVALWWLRKRQPPPSISTDHSGESQARPAPSPSGSASTDLRTSTLGPSTTPGIHVAPGVEREFTDRVDRFEGLYESLHSACVEAYDADECQEVLSEWEVRLTYSGGEALQRTWQDAVHETTGLSMLGNGEAANDEDVISLGTGWLSLLRTWGMERDERTTFVLEEEEKKRYRISGTRQVGEWVEVELPCWTYKGEVIERGIARAIAAPG